MNRSSREWDELARTNAAYSIIALPEFEAGEGERNDAFWESGRRELAQILDTADLGPTDALTVVEIGCGIGRMTRALSERFARVIALDVSPVMIARARELLGGSSNVELAVSSGSDLSGVQDGSADFVFSWYVLQHVPRAGDVLRYVEESARVLRPGGVAFLHMRTSPNRADQALRWLERRLYFALPERARRILHPPRAKSLEAEFAVRFRSWRGTTVLAADVERAGRRSGLTLTRAQEAGAGFTTFRFEKTGGRR